MSAMFNKEIGQKREIGIDDALNQASKLRGAIEYLVDTAQSPELCAVLMTIQDTAEILEETLRIMWQGEMEAGRLKSESTGEDVAFD